MRIQGLDPVPMLVDTVSTSPVVSAGGRSMVNRLDPVLMLVDTVSTSPVVSAGGRSMVRSARVLSLATFSYLSCSYAFCMHAVSRDNAAIAPFSVLIIFTMSSFRHPVVV